MILHDSLMNNNKLFKFLIVSLKSVKLFVLNCNLYFLLFLTLSLSINSLCSYSQNIGVGINISGNPSNSKALLDIDAKDMNPKGGMLVPRMSSSERNTIVLPIPESLLIYNTDIHCFEAYYNGEWIAFGCLGACQIPAQPTAATNTPSQTQIVWNWSPVSGISGYKYGTSSNYSFATDNGTNTTFTQTGLTCNSNDTLYVWSYNNCGNSDLTTLTQFTSCCYIACGGSGNITTFAGNGIAGDFGDGGTAICARLNFASGVAVDGLGNVYIADEGNNKIRKVALSTGIITTIAGTGIAGYNGDNILATNAQLNFPFGVALDASGNVYISDEVNERVRKIAVSTGIITTIAGNGISGSSGDGAPATNSQLASPTGIAVDASGNIYVGDDGNNKIRIITGSDGIISTFAGNGTYGSSGDGGAATNAQFSSPYGIAVDNMGNVYISDWSNCKIRKVSGGIISTFAGNGSIGYNSDGIPATSAQLFRPYGVAVDSEGNVFIADTENNRIRKVTVSTGIISTIAGNGIQGFSGDGGPATSAKLAEEFGVAVDASGNVYIADLDNSRIRIVCH